MEQMRRNLKRVVWILAVLIMTLVARLFWIQILGGEDLKQAACDQSLISLQGANTRGLIYDRNGLPMVADHKRYLYIIRKKDMDFQAAKLLASADAKETGSRGDYYVYSSRKYKKAIGKKLRKIQCIYFAGVLPVSGSPDSGESDRVCESGRFPWCCRSGADVRPAAFKELPPVVCSR